MAKCPYCAAPAVAWRMWRVSRFSGYRCGECGGVSRIPQPQLWKMTWYALSLVIPFGLLVFVAWLAARGLGVAVDTDVLLIVATPIMAVAAMLAMGSIMKRACELVPDDDARGK